jgi:hypothetical protein
MPSGRIKWKKQIMIAGLAILLNVLSVSSSSVSLSTSHDLSSAGFSTQDLECYGFIIPLPAGDDFTYETFLNSRSRCLINDLLRLNITVYWSSCDFSATSQRMQNYADGSVVFYKKGAFIVPF